MSRQLLTYPDLPADVLSGPAADARYLARSGGTLSGMLAVQQGAQPGRLFQRPNTAEIGLTYNVNYTDDWHLDDPGQPGILTHARPDAGVAWGVSIWQVGIGWVTRPWYVSTDGDTMIRDKLLAVSPDAGNVLEWRPNGLHTVGGLTLAAADARYLQPATAAATYLPLAGGTLSGNVLMKKNNAIFSIQTAADTDNRLTLSGGGSSPAIGFGPGNALIDVWLSRLSAGALSLDSHFLPNINNQVDLGATGSRWRKLWAADADFTNAPTVGGTAVALTSHNHSALYVPLAGGAVMTGSLSPTLTNTSDLGTISLRWRSAFLGTLLSIAGASATANQLTHAITTDSQPRLTVDGNGQMKWGPGASTPFDTTLQRTAVGALRLDTHLGVAVNAETTSARPWVRVGQGGALAGEAAAYGVVLMSNTLYNGTTNAAIVAGAGSMVSLSAGTVSFWTAASVGAPGATQNHVQRLVTGNTGQTNFIPDAGVAAIAIGGTAQPKITVAAAAPSSPMTGDVWFW